jgi:hypothetical protein
MQIGKLSKVNMAQRIDISRLQLSSVLVQRNSTIRLDTLFKVATEVGRAVEIRGNRRSKLTRVS